MPSKGVGIGGWRIDGGWGKWQDFFLEPCSNPRVGQKRWLCQNYYYDWRSTTMTKVLLWPKYYYFIITILHHHQFSTPLPPSKASFSVSSWAIVIKIDGRNISWTRGIRLRPFRSCATPRGEGRTIGSRNDFFNSSPPTIVPTIKVIVLGEFLGDCHKNWW